MILLVSCYELGRQPVSVAKALAALQQAGFETAVQDVSLDRLSPDLVRKADLVAISTPMHTALQLGVRVASKVREENPSARIAFFGLYAALNAEHLLARHCDAVIGDSTGDLVAVAGGRRASMELPRTRDATVPSRSALPVLDRYARLEVCGETRVAGAVSASEGCKHLCRHCPIVPVYRGKFVATPLEAVIADVGQQITSGAQHITFTDPDFLNGPTHALRVARELARRFPEVTFDATIKIEHLLQHRSLLRELVECGLLFVTSAVESLNDEVLLRLDKGHTAADVPEALQAVREAGAEPRPTFLPYTPWARLEDVPALFRFADEQDLDVDPVQFTLRLLLPPGSLLVDPSAPWLRSFDEKAFTWTWEHPDPRVDELWRRSSAAAAAGATVDDLRQLAGLPRRVPRDRMKAPRLTEPWFC
ncbi:MAG: CUAEP/CCAEP-tail radical SAM protein [Myxococcales bacterium]|nr:CUAEP/CCAEP-tail radical SAM protein [Myxococcales bacterium]